MKRADLSLLEGRARRIRATCIQMAHDGREGHLSSALSCADILVALYGGWLRVDSGNPGDPARDRFYMSKGHACTALYAVLAERGFVDAARLSEYARGGSPFPNHPCRHALPILENSSGSLGHGLGIATGALYGLRLSGNPARAVVLLSDGECNEGSTWEAAMFARAQKLDRLLAIVDNNGVQAVGRSDAIMGHTSLEEKFKSFGWAAITIDGNSLAELVEALDRFPLREGSPTAIIARTKSGSGVSFMEDDQVWHYRSPSADDLSKALAELDARPIHKEAV